MNQVDQDNPRLPDWDFSLRSSRPAGESDDDTSSEDGFEINGTESYKRPPSHSKFRSSAPPANATQQEALELEPNLAWICSEAIRFACIRGNLDLLKAQVEHSPKFDVNSQFRYREEVPLDIACLHGHLPIVQYLLKELKADPNIGHVHGRSTSLLAVASSFADEEVQEAIAQELVQAGVLLDALNTVGQSALISAAHHDKKKLVSFLLDSGANPNLTDFTGKSVLHLTAIKGSTEMVKLLLDFPATDAQLVDNSGWTAAELAMLNGHRITSMYIHNFVQKSEDSVVPDHSRGGPLINNELDDNVAHMLSVCKCLKYRKNFQKKGVTFTQLLTYNDKDLKKMGIFEVGLRERLLNAIKAVHNTNWSESSMRTLVTSGRITAADVNCEISNAGAQLSHMLTSLEYTQERIEADSKPLAMASERGRITATIQMCRELRGKCTLTSTKLKKLKQVLKKCEKTRELAIMGNLDDSGGVREPLSWPIVAAQGLIIFGLGFILLRFYDWCV